MASLNSTPPPARPMPGWLGWLPALVALATVAILAPLFFQTVTGPASSQTVAMPGSHPDRASVAVTTPARNGGPFVHPPIPAVDIGCVVSNVTPVYFANQLRGKEGPHSYGPTLVPAGGFNDPPSVAQSQGVIRKFWGRLCLDPTFARATLAKLDPTWDVKSPMTWSEILDRIRILGNWDYARAKCFDLGPGLGTYYMVPGKNGAPPTLGAARYPHGESCFLIVPTRGEGSSKFRLECGGQGVFSTKLRNPSIHWS